MSPADGMGPVPADDTIPMQISDTVTRGTVKPTYPVIASIPHTSSGGDAIAGGFVYRGTRMPGAEGQAAVRRHHDRPDLVRRAGRRAPRPTTAIRRRVAPMHELEAGPAPARRRDLSGPRRPGRGAAWRWRRGRPRARGPALREDNAGELYLLTKSDGMIRKVVGAKAATSTDHHRSRPGLERRARRVAAPGVRQPDESRLIDAESIAPASWSTTATVRPATETARKARSKPA